jgi:hypothetical protein
MFVPTKLSFPTLHQTRSDGGISYDHTEFPIDSENFAFYHRNSVTKLECQLEPASISKNRHRRLQEALGFALCHPIWPSAMILRSGCINGYAKMKKMSHRTALKMGNSRPSSVPIEQPTKLSTANKNKISLYSAATWAPFSATERLISSTRKASRTDTTAKIRKQSK